MSEWETLRVGDVADVFDGPHATPKKTPEGPWFLSISSLSDGRLDISESAHLSEADFVKWTRRVTPREGDVLFSYETRLGEAAMMPAGLRACLGRRMGLLRPKRDKIDPRFLLYAYIAPQFQRVINERSVHGATVDRIPLSELPQWSISLPSLREQREIATVLGALDDKIMVNERILSCSDELARATFVHQLRRLGKGRLNGHLLGDLVEHLPGKYLAKEEYVAGGEYRVYGSNSVMGSHHDYLYRGPFSVMARIGSNCGALMWSESSAWVNNNASALRAKPGSDPWFIHRLLETVNMDQHRGGSGQPFIRVESLLATNVAVPGQEEQKVIGSALRALAEKAEAVNAENKILASLRDALLPGLMHGAIRLRNAEKIVEDAA